MSVKETYSPVRVGGSDYEVVAPSQTNQVLGGAGSVGDFLARIVCCVETTATSAVTLTDGTTNLVVSTGNKSLGAHSVELGIRSRNGPWKISTGAGVTVIAIGQFSD